MPDDVLGLAMQFGVVAGIAITLFLVASRATEWSSSNSGTIFAAVVAVLFLSAGISGLVGAERSPTCEYPVGGPESVQVQAQRYDECRAQGKRIRNAHFLALILVFGTAAGSGVWRSRRGLTVDAALRIADTVAADLEHGRTPGTPAALFDLARQKLITLPLSDRYREALATIYLSLAVEQKATLPPSGA